MSLKKPIIINKFRKKVLEVNRKFCLINSNTEDGYKKSIIKLMNNKKLFNNLGKNGHRIYKKNMIVKN